MRLARIYPNDLRDPIIFSRVADIIGYFQGKADRSYWITRLISGKPGLNSIDHLWGYVELKHRHEKAAQDLTDTARTVGEFSNKILEKASLGEMTDPPLVEAYRTARDSQVEQQKQVNYLEAEIAHYEK